MTSDAYALRAGDFKNPISSPVSTLKGNDFKEYRVEFWMVSSGTEIQGVGFTIHGARTTDFITWSDSSPYHVWTRDGQPHGIADLCTRGLDLSKEETSRFMVAWMGNPPADKEAQKVMGGVFATYQRSRRANPPRTYTMAEVAATPWGKDIARKLSEAGVI